MMTASWVIEYLCGVGAVDRSLADLVERFVLSPDAEMAGPLASSIELKVAPPRGGLSPSAYGVVSALVAHMPTMAVSVRPCAVALLAQIAGSLLNDEQGGEHEAARAIFSALPGIGALAQYGDAELQADFVDFAALCAALDPSVARQAAVYLQRLAAEVGGEIGASAQAELDHLGMR